MLASGDPLLSGIATNLVALLGPEQVQVTGQVVRSEANPDGTRTSTTLKELPAQPLPAEVAGLRPAAGASAFATYTFDAPWGSVSRKAIRLPSGE